MPGYFLVLLLVLLLKYQLFCCFMPLSAVLVDYPVVLAGRKPNGLNNAAFPGSWVVFDDGGCQSCLPSALAIACAALSTALIKSSGSTGIIPSWSHK